MSKPIVRYYISVKLDAARKALEGHERLTWLNDSPDAVGELRFHLYMNAFKNEKTSISTRPRSKPGCLTPVCTFPYSRSWPVATAWRRNLLRNAD